MGIEQVLSAPRSPLAKGLVERIIGTMRRECLDHVIIFNEAAPYRQVKSFAEYYHGPEPVSLPGGAGRAVAQTRTNRVYSASRGLHHRY
jgi:hypothetical protein